MTNANTTPSTPTTPVGAPCWIDLLTADRDAVLPFYEKVLGWSADAPNPQFGGYLNMRSGGHEVAGCMEPVAEGPDGGPVNVWTVYLATNDIAATAAAVRANGGQVIVEPMPVADLGIMAVFTDPGGAAVGAWQAGTFSGIPHEHGHGQPMWFELMANSYEQSVAFYEKVFAWPVSVLSDGPEFRYVTHGPQEQARAGIMDVSTHSSCPPHWRFYAEVKDVDASARQIRELGGKVLEEPQDTPYGRIAQVTDPLEAAFLIGTPPA